MEATDQAPPDTRQPGGDGERTAPAFDAFISYSHRADDDLAPRLRDALHRLAKPWYRKRALRVFLDEAAMSAEPGLWPGIVRALDRSKAFVLLLSPESASSVWVGREIRHWLDRRGTDAMYLVLTDGEIVWDATRNDFDAAGSTAVHEVLRGAFRDEPRHVDLRWAQGQTDLTLRNARFLDSVAEVAAPLHHMSKDDLVGSDLLEHRRTLRYTRGAVALLSVLLLVSVLAGVTARRNATRAEQRRIDAQAVRLRAESGLTGIPTDLGFLLAAEAYRMRPTEAARWSLISAVQRTPDATRYLRVHTSRVVSVAVSDDGKTVVSLDVEGNLVASDTTTGRRLAAATVERRGAGVVADAGAVIVSGLTQVEWRDWRTLAVRSRITAPEVLAGAAPLRDGRVLLATLQGGVATPTSGTPTASVTWTKVASSIAAVGGAGSTGILVSADPSNHSTVMTIALPASGPPTAGWTTIVDDATAVVPTADGTGIAVATTAGYVALLRASDGSVLTRTGAAPNPLRSIAASSSTPQWLMVATDGGDYTYVDPVRSVGFNRYALHVGPTNSIAWSPSGMAATGGADGVVVLLDTIRNRINAGRRIDIAPRNLELAPDGTTLTWVDGKGNIAVSLLDDGGRITRTTPIGHVVDPLDLANLGDLGVAVTDTKGALVVLRSDGSTLRAAATSGAQITELIRLGTDRVVGLRSNGLVHVWRVTDRAIELVRTITDRASALAVQANGSLVAYFEIGAGLVAVDANDGSERLRVPLTQLPARVLAVHPDGTSVAVVDASEIAVYPVGPNGGPPIQIAASGDLAALRFVDGGRNLVAADSASGITLLSVADGGRSGNFVDEDGFSLRALGVGASSNRVVLAYAGLQTYEASVHSFDPARTLASGCSIFGRPFTDGEVHRFDLDRTDDPCANLPAPAPVAGDAAGAGGAASASTVRSDAADPAVGQEALAHRIAPAIVATQRATQSAAGASNLTSSSGALSTGHASETCVVAALARLPWTEFAEVVRTHDAGGEAFSARAAPLVRWCRSPEGALATTTNTFDDLWVSIDELVPRWNDAVTSSKAPVPTITGDWSIVQGAATRRLGDDGTMLVTPSAPGSRRVSSITITLRSTRDGAAVTAALSVLAEGVEGRLRAPSVVAAFDVDALLATPGTRLARVGRGSYGITSTKSSVQLIVSI